MRRTESKQGLPDHFGVASFVWDATEDGPVSVTLGTYLRGEIPFGSTIIGGFTHVTKVISGGPLYVQVAGSPKSAEFREGKEADPLVMDKDPRALVYGDSIVSVPSITPAGSFLVHSVGTLSDPQANYDINTLNKTTPWIVANTQVTQGQIAVYIFYVTSELLEFGQMKTPKLYKRSANPIALPSEIKYMAVSWDDATDGPLPAGKNLLRGEMPAGSVLIGGYLHITKTVVGTVSVEVGLGDTTLYGGGATLPVGLRQFDTARWSTPTANMVIDTPSKPFVQVGGATVTAGQFSLYMFYITNQSPDLEFPLPGRGQRTESPQAAPGEIRVAAMGYEFSTDGPLPSGADIYLGELPSGSILVGGFLQIANIPFRWFDDVVKFFIGTNTVIATSLYAAPGWYELDLGRFADPTKNLLITNEVNSRVKYNMPAGPPVTNGRFTLYLFYVNNELGQYGQITNPHSSQIT